MTARCKCDDSINHTCEWCRLTKTAAKRKRDKFYRKFKEKVCAKTKAYRKANPEKIKQIRAAYKAKNPEIYTKKYRQMRQQVRSGLIQIPQGFYTDRIKAGIEFRKTLAKRMAENPQMGTPKTSTSSTRNWFKLHSAINNIKGL